MNIMLIGGGKIARGFLGHLLFRSNLPFYIVEYNQDIVTNLNKKNKYTVQILGEKSFKEEVSGFVAFSYNDMPKILELISYKVNLVFISVGGKNLKTVGQWLKEGLFKRFQLGNTEFLNIILAENWIKPEEIIKEQIYEDAEQDFLDFLDSYIGLTVSAIMRSAIEPPTEELKKNPTMVNVQDYWYLPVDASRIKGSLPEITALDLVSDFGAFLDKKFYTNNTANATVAYLGSLKGYTYLFDAARDSDILDILMGVYRETSLALCSKHGLDINEQMKFTRASLAKMQNKYLVDYVERNARDPIRKLGSQDRLIGSARLVLEYEGCPEYLATSIAAALHYTHDKDPFAIELKKLREEKGTSYILESICQLTEKEVLLKDLIFEKIEVLKEKNWIS